MVTRKHVKIVNVITLAFAAMTIVSLALFIAGVWPVWEIFGFAFATNSCGLLSHVLMDEVLRRETYEHMRTNVIQLRNEIETLRMAMVFPDSLSKLRKTYLTDTATGMFLSLIKSDKSPMKDGTHVYTFRLGAFYDGNPVFVTLPVNIDNPPKNPALEPGQLLNLMTEVVNPAAAKLVTALLKNRDCFKFGGHLTVDIIAD